MSSNNRDERRIPYYPFYVDDFIGGTVLFSQAEIGAYVLLLNYQFSNGGLPSDMNLWSQIARGEVSDLVKEKFALCEDGLWKQHRMQRVRDERMEYVEMRRQNGRLGGRPPSDNHKVNHVDNQVSRSVASRKPNKNQEVNQLDSTEQQENYKMGEITQIGNHKVNHKDTQKPNLKGNHEANPSISISISKEEGECARASEAATVGSRHSPPSLGDVPEKPNGRKPRKLNNAEMITLDRKADRLREEIRQMDPDRYRAAIAGRNDTVKDPKLPPADLERCRQMFRDQADWGEKKLKAYESLASEIEWIEKSIEMTTTSPP